MSSNKPARAADTTALAASLVSYLGERARREGVPMTHDARFFEAALRAGIRIFYGIETDGRRFIRDTREPEPGFLSAWLTLRPP